jgi:hypothetical protein
MIYEVVQSRTPSSYLIRDSKNENDYFFLELLSIPSYSTSFTVKEITLKLP